MWNDVTYLSPNLNYIMGNEQVFHATFHNGCNYLSMPGFKLNYVSERDTCGQTTTHTMHNKAWTVYSIWIHATYCKPDQMKNRFDFHETQMGRCTSHAYEREVIAVCTRFGICLISKGCCYFMASHDMQLFQKNYVPKMCAWLCCVLFCYGYVVLCGLEVFLCCSGLLRWH